MSSVRTRNWLAVCYPDSCPSDPADIIESWQITAYLSPLHDSDRKADGTIKKAHWHVIVCFDGPVSYARAMDLFSQLGCATCQVCNSFVGSLRYLCHLDHPSKFQYCTNDIRTFGFADLSALDMVTASQNTFNFVELTRLADSLHVTNWALFFRWVRDDYPDYLTSVMANYEMLYRYVNSCRFIASDAVKSS